VFFCGWWFEGEENDWFGLIRMWYLCCSFYGFGGDSGVNLKVIFVKVYKRVD